MTSGANVTEVAIVWTPRSNRERAVLIVTLRPGLYPTEEAHQAIRLYLWALSRLMAVRDV